MKRFKYKAKDEGGILVTGEVEASNQEHAAKLIRQKGLFVISIKGSAYVGLDIVKSFQDRVSSGEVTTFTRQMATMIYSGLPITEALSILEAQTKGAMRKVIGQISNDVQEGGSLSTAMTKHPRAFTKTYVAIIKAGEIGGVLDQVLNKLADTLEQQQEFRGRVKGAMVYPIIILVGMFIVSIVMLVYVIPRLTTLYVQLGADLPITTRFLIATSNFMIKFWFLVILGIFGLFYAFKVYRASDEGRRVTDQLLFNLPLIGDLQKQITLAELTRTLSLMVGSGVSILEALAISAGVVGNVVIKEALEEVTKMVEKGFPLAFAFSRHPEAFPFILSQMIAVGEETGKIDEVLAKVSHVFEVESDQKVKVLTAAVEPAILIFLGIGVAFLVISVILPIYNLTTLL